MPDAATADAEPSAALIATANTGPTMNTSSVMLDSMLYVVSSTAGSFTTLGHKVRAQTSAGGWHRPINVDAMSSGPMAPRGGRTARKMPAPATAIAVGTRTTV